MSAKKTTLAILQYVIGLGLGAGLMYWVFKDLDFEELWHNITGADPVWFLAAMGMAFTAHWLRGYRWAMLIKASGYQVSSNNAFAAVMVAYMANNAFPRLGEITRCSVLVKSNKVPFSVSVGTVFTERAIDVIGLFILIGLVFVLEFTRVLDFIQSLYSNPQPDNPKTNPFYWVIPVLAFLTVFAFAVYRMRKRLAKVPLIKKIINFGIELIKAAWSIKQVSAPSIFILVSVGIWVGYILATWFAMLALKNTSTLSLYFGFIVTMFGAIGMALPVPGGVGTYHKLIETTFSIFGYSKAIGAELALFMHTPQIIINTIAGGIGYFFLILQKPKS